MKTSVVCIYERTKDYYAVEYKTNAHVQWDRKEIPNPVVDVTSGEPIPCIFDAWERKDTASGETISGFAVRLRGTSSDYEVKHCLGRKYSWENVVG